MFFLQPFTINMESFGREPCQFPLNGMAPIYQSVDNFCYTIRFGWRQLKDSLLEAEYNEHADTNANGAAFCRSAALMAGGNELAPRPAMLTSPPPRLADFGYSANMFEKVNRVDN
ncbi:uncharacterized protein LOC141627347 isoform X2 [Silene latifolia]|uniref:uncharacterized protein LOC141627347 isoform X2 n=1 Tax=Silene latifolia TaxID=37657 RepID=UPI003D772C3A